MPRVALAIGSALLFVLPSGAAAQDYVQYEVQYLKVLPGHAQAFEEALAEHNRTFHAAAPYQVSIDYVATGPNAGQMLYYMGPTTFSELDGRPSSPEHAQHWTREVLSHAESHSNAFWRMNAALSTPRSAGDATPRPLIRSRGFVVADNALFLKTQQQIEEVLRSRGVTGRSFYSLVGRDIEGPHWVLVTASENWSELDEPGLNFAEAFVEVHGANAWATFVDERDAAVVGVQDEWRQRAPELGSSGNE